MTQNNVGIYASQISGHLYGGPYGAYDSLATVTVPSGGVASVTFAGIPSGYQHLHIGGGARTDRGYSTLQQIIPTTLLQVMAQAQSHLLQILMTED